MRRATRARDLETLDRNGLGAGAVTDREADDGSSLGDSSPKVFPPAKTPPPRRSTRLRKAARASPTSHFDRVELGDTSGSSAAESPTFDSEEEREERPWREQMTEIFRALGR